MLSAARYIAAKKPDPITVLGSPGLMVRSPPVGTAHLADKVGGKPFAREAKTVMAGGTLLLSEVLKVEFRVLAPLSGTIVAVQVSDGSPIEYDQPLIIISCLGIYLSPHQRAYVGMAVENRCVHSHGMHMRRDRRRS